MPRSSPLVGFFRGYVLRHLPQYLLGALMLVATNLAVVRIPALIGQTLDRFAAGGAEVTSDARALCLELFAWASLVIVVRTASRILFFNPGREIEFRLRGDLFRHLLTLGRPFYAHRKVGELVSIATNDIQSVRLLVGFAGLQIWNVAVAVPMHLVQMLETDVVLTLWCLSPVAAGAVYMRYTVQRFYRLVHESLAELARLSDRVLESYAGIATIRAHGAQAGILRRFDAANADYLALMLRVTRLRAFAMPVLALSGFLGTGIVLWVGGERVIEGDLSLGALATFTALVGSLVATLTSLAWVLAAVSRGIVAYGRVDQLLATPSVPLCDGVPLGLVAPPSIEVRALTHRYEGQPEPALADVSFRIGAGQTLGVFGKTGSGKTTLIEVLARIHELAPGTIFFDGHDLAKAPLREVRQAVALVPQSPFLFSASIRENVELAAPEVALPRLVPPLAEVLRQAHVEEDVAKLPQGVDTIVGERGVLLSGGQRQRVALARALRRGAPVLLLDDVMSAVDQVTEQKLVAALSALRHGDRPPTTVIVSHRTRILEQADEIVVLDKGRIVARGRHAALVTGDNPYAKAHRHQAGQRG